MTVSDGARGPVIVCHGGVNWHHVGGWHAKTQINGFKGYFCHAFGKMKGARRCLVPSLVCHGDGNFLD